jgi:DNA-binding MarR family transcriptional regulator
MVSWKLSIPPAFCYTGAGNRIYKGALAMADPLNQQAQHHDATGPAIAEIMALLSKVARKLEPENTETREWMVQHCRNPAIIELLRDMTLMTGRVLDAIGRLEPVNGVTISTQFRIPKGTVSKITRRLIAKKLIQKESLANNKKEVLFRLTPLGRELFEVHRAFDQQMERGLIKFLQRYSADELRFIVHILQELTETSFLAEAIAAPAP